MHCTLMYPLVLFKAKGCGMLPLPLTCHVWHMQQYTISSSAVHMHTVYMLALAWNCDAAPFNPHRHCGPSHCCCCCCCCCRCCRLQWYKAVSGIPGTVQVTVVEALPSRSSSLQHSELQGAAAAAIPPTLLQPPPPASHSLAVVCGDMRDGQWHTKQLQQVPLPQGPPSSPPPLPLSPPRPALPPYAQPPLVH